MSALPPKADIIRRADHIRFVPEADVCAALPAAVNVRPQRLCDDAGGM